MNIIKRMIKRLKGENPYTEKRLDNAEIIVGETENLTREQRLKRFDAWYKEKDKKSKKKLKNSPKRLNKRDYISKGTIKT